MTDAFPDESGYSARCSGAFVAETLMEPVNELEEAHARYRLDSEFLVEFEAKLRHHVGCPSPHDFARRRSEEVGRARASIIVILSRRSDRMVPSVASHQGMES